MSLMSSLFFGLSDIEVEVEDEVMMKECEIFE